MAYSKYILWAVFLVQVCADDRLESLRKLLCDSEKVEEPKCCNTSSLPLVALGKKFYYFNHFYGLNWYKAYQFCRFHKMSLCTISNQEENDLLEGYLHTIHFEKENFWTSGTDLGSEGKYYWMSNGSPLTFTDWGPAQPDNSNVGDEHEHCLQFIWGGEFIRWNDNRCSIEMFFICESDDYCLQ